MQLFKDIQTVTFIISILIIWYLLFQSFLKETDKFRKRKNLKT